MLNLSAVALQRILTKLRRPKAVSPDWSVMTDCGASLWHKFYKSSVEPVMWLHFVRAEVFFNLFLAVEDHTTIQYMRGESACVT